MKLKTWISVRWGGGGGSQVLRGSSGGGLVKFNDLPCGPPRQFESSPTTKVGAAVS